MTINCHGLDLLLLYQLVGEEQGVSGGSCAAPFRTTS